MNYRILFITLITGLILTGCRQQPAIPKDAISCDVLVYGNGTGAISAAIQSARGGANTVLVSPCPWLGGMMTSAGVSAIDGNHNLPSGLYGEFRDQLYAHYGGPENLATGWVSHTNFEPHVGNQIWKNIANQTEGLTILYDYELQAIQRREPWIILFSKNNMSKSFSAKILIDGTDLGDLLPLLQIPHDIGWDQDLTKPVDLDPGQNYIQDLTYCAILKDYGHEIKVSEPAAYDPSEFQCCCQHECQDPELHPCSTMLSYARLPNDKYLLNWPINGNDLFPSADIFDLEKRASILDQAKEKTLRYAYYIHDELGYRNLWLANDEFETEDQLPYLAYYREARRMHGQVKYTLRHVLNPYERNLYRTGIAVGDYPVDHHHDEYPGHHTRATFPEIPSFTIPLGVVIPKDVENFLVADKSISVSHEANGSTRLQPVITQIGQAAGALAALAVEQEISPSKINIREVQNILLNHKVYLQPFLDVSLDVPEFKIIQEIGSTGILRGKGIPFQWANQTWFYPDTTVDTESLLNNIKDLIPEFSFDQKYPVILNNSTSFLIMHTLKEMVDEEFLESKTNYLNRADAIWEAVIQTEYDPFRQITKRELAILLGKEVDPFNNIPIDLKGNTYITPSNQDKVIQ